MALAAREAPSCLPGAGREGHEPLEILARSEAGDDGRLRSRRPGAGSSGKAYPVRPQQREPCPAPATVVEELRSAEGCVRSFSNQ